MSRLTLAVFVLTATLTARINAASIYVTIPNVLGDNPIPGSPNAILAESLEVDTGDFIITKAVDKASPKIAADVATGVPLSPLVISLFNAAPTATPDLQLSFSKVIASARVISDGHGTPQIEEDTFSTPQASLLYLELPGISGGSKREAHPDLIPLQSFTLDGSGLSIVKDVDTSSPELALAAKDGEIFPTASILVYDTTDPNAPPLDAIVFDNVAASSFLPSVNQGVTETDGFNFGIVAAAPEPGAFVLWLCGLFIARLRPRAVKRT